MSGRFILCMLKYKKVKRGASACHIGTGTNWRITIRKAPKVTYED